MKTPTRILVFCALVAFPLFQATAAGLEIFAFITPDNTSGEGYLNLRNTNRGNDEQTVLTENFTSKGAESAKKPQKQTGKVFTEFGLVSMGFKKSDLRPHYLSPVFVKKAIPLGDLARELQFDLTSVRATDQASGPDDAYHVLIPTGICYIGYVSGPEARDGSNPKTWVNATVLQVPLRPFTDEKDPNKANALQPPLTDKQIEAVSPVIKDLAAALQLLGDRFPEMKSFDPKKIVATTGTSVGVAFSHGFKGLREKRAIRPEDFGPHGISFSFACCRPMLLDGGFIHASSGEPPMMKLQNLDLEVYYGVRVGPNPSDGVRDEVMKILKKHAEILADIDKGHSQPVDRDNPDSTGAPPEQEAVESLPTALSPKARAFVESVEKDPTGFFFSVCFWEQTGMSQGIAFALEAAHKYDKTSVLMDKKEAMAITLHFANNGMLDKTDVPPAGVPLTGWNVNLSTKKVGAYWHLGGERDALLKSVKVMGVRSVLTGKSLKAWDDFTQSVRNGISQPIAEPEPDRPSKSESATGIEVDWGGVKMTSPEPRILPASMKDKIRERMSPRKIVTTFGKGWMSKHSSVGSISWRFEDGSMIHMTYRPGTTLVDQAVDVHRHEPQRKEGETIKTDDGIKNTK